MIWPWLAAFGVGAWLFGSKRFDKPRYPFGSPEQIELFTAAADYAHLPADWATHPALKYILAAESGNGWVGIPNYLWKPWMQDQGLDPNDHASWPAVWDVIRRGDARPSFTGINSHAAGLGQLQPGAMAKYQPDGIKGVGDPFNEAVGMLRYISDRYGTMDAAQEFWAAHQWY